MIEGVYDPGDATPAQLKELEDALNALAADPAWKHKIVVLPPSGPPPNVMLNCQDSRVWLECPCGWTWDVHTGKGMTGFNLGFLRDLARHDCNTDPPELAGE